MRQLAIQRWLERICIFAGVRSQHWFLTTSEADTVLFIAGFPALKLPSKSIVERAGVPKASYVAMARQWTWSALGQLRPDVLVVDTFPNGSFHELAVLLDVVPRKVLVLRPVKEEFARRASYEALCTLYDRVIVPDDANGDGVDAMREALGAAAGRVVGCAPILRVERPDLLTAEVARLALGAESGRKVVVVCAGGGGDAGVDALFDAAEAAVAGRDDVHLVFAAGPLCRSTPRRGAHRTWLADADLGPLWRGADVALTAGGYNVVHELAFVGVAAVLVAQTKIADDQAARIARLVEAGAARSATLDDPAALRAAVVGLLDDAEAREDLRRAAREVVPLNGAREAALAILADVLPRSVLRQATAELDDELLRAQAALGVSLDALVALARALAADDDPAALELESALELCGHAAARDAGPELLRQLADRLARKLPASEVRPALAALLDAPIFADALAALPQLLGTLCQEHRLDGASLVQALAALADSASNAAVDLFGLARRLSDARGADSDGRSTNQIAFARVSAELATNGPVAGGGA